MFELYFLYYMKFIVKRHKIKSFIIESLKFLFLCRIEKETREL